jgi:putative addiction module component (TIGR02574 family)
MTTGNQFNFSHLTIAERIRLAQDLLESVYPRTQDLPLSDAERREIDRRWKAFEEGRMAAAPWDEVRKRVFG